MKYSDMEKDVLVCVEPIAVFNSTLEAQYKTKFNKVYIENVVIVGQGQEKEIPFYICLRDKRSYDTKKYRNSNYSLDFGCSSIHKDFILSQDFRGFKFTEMDLFEQKVKALTLQELVNKYNITKINTIFVDAEGEDLNILQNFDIEKYMPETIHFEDPKNYNDVLPFHERLSSLGYTIFKFTGFGNMSTTATLKPNPKDYFSEKFNESNTR
jgi:hypothetical protein